jgi:predicted Zn-dependent protease
METTENAYLETTTLKEILNISEDVLDHAMGIAYHLYRCGRYADAEIVCKGLLACDHRYWWPRSLYASVLRQLGRLNEALVQVEAGLRYEPLQPKLLLMRAELLVTLARDGHTGPSTPNSSTPAPVVPAHAESGVAST